MSGYGCEISRRFRYLVGVEVGLYDFVTGLDSGFGDTSFQLGGVETQDLSGPVQSVLLVDG